MIPWFESAWISRWNRWIGMCTWIDDAPLAAEQGVHRLAREAGRVGDVHARLDAILHRERPSGWAIENRRRAPHVRVGRVDLQHRLAELQVGDRSLRLVEVVRERDLPAGQPLVERVDGAPRRTDGVPPALTTSTGTIGWLK